MTRAKTGSLYGQVPSAAAGDVSDEDGEQSDSQLGGYAVEEPDGASPHDSALESGDDGSYATVDSRIGRAAPDNLGRNASVRRWGASFSTAAAGVILTQYERCSQVVNQLSGQTTTTCSPA